MTGAHRLVNFLGFGTDELQVNALVVQGEWGFPLSQFLRRSCVILATRMGT